VPEPVVGNHVGGSTPEVPGYHHRQDEEVVEVADVRRLPGPNADLWDWQLHAACRGMDSAFFFHPDGERGPARASRERRAKAVCESCPVMEPCRRHALAAGEPYGIWGGLSESERSAAAGGRRSVAPVRDIVIR
jgi:WhiB family transcriptional regulator, redox-sensing transcriptional regulator